ncbi:MAG TPA: PTS sugar transporter subunit IIA [Treponemataceae bacterium]|jgi:PTS system nitrogen regulatory IIA component|nr:MAG: PTS system fructose-specific EIIABC component [Spirochaetes bacterium ADurb.Bin269]TAH54971.1 MAG: PTS sugar transporter subunit IIA [Treponema sp.]HOC28056.1 PTS sugar transporter subunit IIA [Treponemataceae bacterium]HQL31730.1 PTS sugar transporter subunit IIA [Treponemataceae bacterium]
MRESEDIASLIQKGGVYYNISGETPCAVFADAVAQLVLPSGVDPEVLKEGLCERERLMTTSVGSGIALPHPRTPVISSEEDQRVYVCYLDKAVNFDAMDGKPVSVLFIILSTGSQSHLKVLSRLSWFLQQESFRSALKEKPDAAELVSAIKKIS